MPNSDYPALKLALEVICEGRGATLPPTLQTEDFLQESASLQRDAQGWSNGPGIQGLGIAPKTIGGHTGKTLALKVYVERKKPRSKCRYPVPKQVRIPGGPTLPTDVEEIGRIVPEVYPDRMRPAQPGCGLGHFKVTVGTFGCLVKKKGDAKSVYILSNSHVLANQGLAVLGTPILQPGHMDSGRSPKDKLATLTQFVPFRYSKTGFPNLVDAAIAKVTRRASVVAKIRLLGVKPQGVSTYLRRGMHVQKVGRTTDFTVGETKDVDFRLGLTYRSAGGRRRRVGLKDQVLCTRYTAGGDSGAAVLNTKKKMIGLHFAGSPSTSIFNRIVHVMRLLEIRLF